MKCRYCPNGRLWSVAICLTLSLILVNCASNRIWTIDQTPDCKTSVEGYYHCEEPWYKTKPAMIIRQGTRMLVIGGEIVSRDDNGVTFDANGEVFTGDPEPEYYPFKDIEALIDDDGEVVYGTIPDMYSRSYALELHMTSKDTTESKSLKLLLKPNRRFGFCVPAGDYIVSKIQFKNDYNGIIDEGVDIPCFSVSVVENKSNYIGDIYMDCGEDDLEDPIVIQYKMARRRDGVSDSRERDDTVLVGVLFGGIAAGIYEASKDEKPLYKDPRGIVGEHKLFIKNNDEFSVKGVSPRIDNIILLPDLF